MSLGLRRSVYCQGSINKKNIYAIEEISTKKQRINDLPQPPSSSPTPKKSQASHTFSCSSPPKKDPTTRGFPEKAGKNRPWRWCCYNYCWPCLMLMANHLCKVVPYNWAYHPPTAPCYLTAKSVGWNPSGLLMEDASIQKQNPSNFGTPTFFFF